MPHNASYPSQRRCQPYRQQGSMLIMAIFMIVVLTLLVSALGRVLSSSSQTTAVEVRATRALMAAQSGLEYYFYAIDKYRDKAEHPDKCGTPTTSSEEITLDLSEMSGFEQCSVTVSCKLVETPTPGSISSYEIKSTGTCGQALTENNSAQDISTDFAVSRVLTAQAK